MTRKALGRGLEALIPTRTTAAEPPPAPTAVADLPAAGPLEVDIERIRPNRFQPRQNFDAAKLEELAESMRENGVLQPLLVAPRGDDFELVAGERRWRAAKMAGLQKVPVVVRDVDGREALRLSILENVQREDLNPLEEAHGYQRLLDEFGMTQEEIGARLGKSRSAVSNALRLLHLPAELQQRIQTGELTPGHARALLGAATQEEQAALAALVRDQKLSVRETEAAAQERRGTTVRTRPAARAENPALRELAGRLEARFGTRVRIQTRKPDGSAGRIEIDYYSAVDLERIFAAAGVPYLL
jgi:ParB family transcriptional regulator, chromosome partitioning protein